MSFLIGTKTPQEIASKVWRLDRKKELPPLENEIHQLYRTNRNEVYQRLEAEKAKQAKKQEKI